MKNSSIFEYPISNDTDTDWGLTITTAGYHKIYEIEAYPPDEHPTRYDFDPKKGRVLNEYQIIYTTRGSGTFKSKHSPLISLNEGDIYMLFPGEWHTYKPDEKTGWDEYWVGFKGENMNKLVDAGFFNINTPKQNIGINEDIVSLYNNIIDIATHENAGCQQLMAGIVSHILGIVYFTVRNKQFADKEIINRINKAKVMMHDNTSSEMTPELIAKELNLSYSWFRRAFKEYTGIAPAKYMNELKLRKAKTMLVTTAMSIKEISISLHFDNVEYFSTFFKKLTEKTPLEYRSNNSKFSDK